MFNLFRRPATTAPTPKVRLGVESLDRRDLPSASLVGGTLTIEGTNYEDVVNVGTAGAFVTVQIGKFQNGSPVAPGVVIPYTTGQLQKVVFNGYGDDDRFTNSTSIPSSFNGGSGDDYAVGGSGDDYLYGSAGDDVIYGGEGDDSVVGWSGDDLLRGNDGDDHISGGLGYDVLSGQAGDDLLDGGVDGIADYLHGGSGADTFVTEFYWDYNPYTHWAFPWQVDTTADYNGSDGDQKEWVF